MGWAEGSDTTGVDGAADGVGFGEWVGGSVR
jgi:hypothetical protein